MASETHPLQSGWSIWEQREPQAKKAAFSDIIFKLCTFRSVEEFWGYWNNIPKPSNVLFDGFSKKKFVDRSVDSFAVFKEGIRPEWEDPANKTGSEWSIRKEIPGDVLDECWERLVLGAIGEVLDRDDEITGVRLLHKNNIRDKKDSGNNYRYEIWLRTTDRARADAIRGKVMEYINAGNPGTPWTQRDFTFKNH